MTPHTHTLETGYTPLPLPPEPSAPPLSHPNSIAYFKRFKMEADLAGLPTPVLSSGLSWRAWSPDLLALHAEALFLSFRDQIDALVFPSLGNREGCLALMTAIALRTGFMPEATWLLLHEGQPCGTVQGVQERRGLGAIQNVGIVPSWRGQGLGGLLVQQSMFGFLQAGLSRVGLEVTSQNERALRLYKRLGYRRIKTIYKTVPVSLTGGFHGEQGA